MDITCFTFPLSVQLSFVFHLLGSPEMKTVRIGRGRRGWAWWLLLAVGIWFISGWWPGLAGEESSPSPPAALAAPAPSGTDPHTPKSLEELKALEERVKRVVAKVIPATVGVQVGSARGSGVIVSPDGLVMTAGHVVGKPNLPATFFFADGRTAKGTTLGVYETADAGLMKITEGSPWPAVEQGSSTTLEVGSWCVATGHPLGYQPGRPPVVRVGRVLRVRSGSIQSDCPLVAGDSGGPLFDLDGKLIGIHSRIGGAIEQNLHVPVDIFKEHWQRLLKGDAWEDTIPSRESQPIKALFRPVVSEAARCVVRIKCDDREVALGSIVGPDGWVLTKASELKGKVLCRLSDGREFEARIVGISQPFDLAMLKINAHDLPVIPWSEKKPVVGQWLAAAGPQQEPLALGVLSAPERRIPPASGAVGIVLKLADGKVTNQIDRVFPQSPAERAGLKDGDVITHVNGQPTPTGQELIQAIRSHRPGDTVRLNVRRGEQTLAIPVKLAPLEAPGNQRRDQLNRIGGVSQRYDDFPAVLQHDGVLRPADCGGPLVDLSGKVVGINIARAGRTETYSISTDILWRQMYDLMSGRLHPDRLAAEKKAAEKAAAEMPPPEKAAEMPPPEKKPPEKPPAEQTPSGKNPSEKTPSDKNGPAVPPTD
jgi:serine protease Do